MTWQSPKKTKAKPLSCQTDGSGHCLPLARVRSGQNTATRSQAPWPPVSKFIARSRPKKTMAGHSIAEPMNPANPFRLPTSNPLPLAVLLRSQKMTARSQACSAQRSCKFMAWQRPRKTRCQAVHMLTGVQHCPSITSSPIGSQCGGRGTLTSSQYRNTVGTHRGERIPTWQHSNFPTPGQQTTSP